MFLFNAFIQCLNYLFRQPKDALTMFSASWAWGLAADELKVALVRKDSAQQTYQLTLSFPLVVCVIFTLGLSERSLLQIAIGRDQIATSGFTVNSRSASVYWNFNGYDRTGLFREYAWIRLAGTPTYTSQVEDPIRVVYTQPAGFGYIESTHEMILTRSCVRWRWPRFWKKDVEVIGYDISLDTPPLVKARGLAACLGPHDGIYGVFASRAKNVDAAIEYYRTIVFQRRLTDSHSDVRELLVKIRTPSTQVQVA